MAFKNKTKTDSDNKEKRKVRKKLQIQFNNKSITRAKRRVKMNGGSSTRKFLILLTVLLAILLMLESTQIFFQFKDFKKEIIVSGRCIW